MESDISVDIAQLIANSSASEDEKNEMAMLLSLNSMSHLHIACLLGSINAVKKCICSGADVNSHVTNSYNWCKKGFDISRKVRENSTPLHLAMEFNHKEVVEYLLKHGADVYAQDSLGFTPIHLVMSLCGLESIEDLSRMVLATPNLRDSVSTVGLSHLHVAAWANNPEAVDKLLLNGAQVDCVINKNAKRIAFLDYYAGKTPLFLTRSNATVKRLLEAGANMDAKDLKGISALQHSLRYMDSEPVGEFIRAVKKGKGDVESCGMTLLHVACGYLDIKWVRKLLRKGANANARIRDKGNQLRGATPLHVVLDQHLMTCNSYETLVEFVELLISNGADVSIKCREATVLHYLYEIFLSSYVYDLEVDAHLVPDILRTAVLLLQNLKSYDINPANSNGFSHFHLACLVNDVESAVKFLDCGVDVNEPMNSSDYDDECYGFAPLHFAMIHRSADVAYLLLTRGANVNVKDVDDNTPLHLAVKSKFVDLPLIELMINRGADVNAKNKDGETLLYLLWRYSGLTAERLEFFWNHGCFINIVDTMNAFSNSKYDEYDN